MALMRWVWKVWGRFLAPKKEVTVVYIKEPLVPMVEDEESIRALATHPGFVALTNRFKVQKALLESRLQKNRHDSIRDVDSLQQAVFWAEFYQKQVNDAVFKKDEARAVASKPRELIEFQKIIAQIESV